MDLRRQSIALPGALEPSGLHRVSIGGRGADGPYGVGGGPEFVRRDMGDRGGLTSGVSRLPCRAGYLPCRSVRREGG